MVKWTRQLPSRIIVAKWKPQVLVMRGNRSISAHRAKTKITGLPRSGAAKFRNPVAFITKNRPATRDIDLLVELFSADNAVCECW